MGWSVPPDADRWRMPTEPTAAALRSPRASFASDQPSANGLRRDPRVAFGYTRCLVGLCMLVVCGVMAIVMPDRLGVLLVVGLMGVGNMIFGAGCVVYYGRRGRD